MNVRSRFTMGFSVLMAVVPLCMADHYHISGPFVRGQLMYNHSITLSAADPNFIADFADSNAATYAQLWAAAGNVSPTSGPGSGVAQIYRAYDPWYLYQIHLGDPSGGSGSLIYHFVANGYFSGGTASVDAYYSGATPAMFIATSTTAPTGSGTSGTPYYWNDIIASWPTFQKKTFDQYNTRVTYTVNVPAGKEFWLALGKPDGSGSVYAQVMSVTVHVTFGTDPTACANSYSADLNGDCKVNLKDFAIIAQNWLNCSDADNPQNCMGAYGLDGWEI
jgi:hypothetical protein